MKCTACRDGTCARTRALHLKRLEETQTILGDRRASRAGRGRSLCLHVEEHGAAAESGATRLVVIHGCSSAGRPTLVEPLTHTAECVLRARMPRSRCSSARWTDDASCARRDRRSENGECRAERWSPSRWLCNAGKGLTFFFTMISLYLYCHTITESDRKQSVRECRGAVSPLHFHSEISIFTRSSCRLAAVHSALSLVFLRTSAISPLYRATVVPIARLSRPTHWRPRPLAPDPRPTQKPRDLLA
jgi:hypothetical protein